METTTNLVDHLLEQLTWHWDHHLRPRLDGLTDDEYLWEPAPDAWSIRRRGTSTAPVQGGSGDWVVEFAFPEPTPAPVTTIAWRLAHLIVGIFGTRAADHFGGPAIDYFSHAYAGEASAALAQLDETYARWIEGARGLDAQRLWSPIGESEGEFSSLSYADLVLHINRETIHHGAEILLLRDLYSRMR